LLPFMVIFLYAACLVASDRICRHE